MDPSQPLSDATLAALRQKLAEILEPLRHRRITPDRITERALIANGGFGGVREAELREHTASPTFEKVAVKRLFPQGDDIQRVEISTAFARELKTWAATDHPNILPLIGFFLDTESSVALFISPLMPHGSIRTYIRKTTPGPAKRLDLAIDTADGLAYLHSLDPPICHGDIKPSNVVINHELRAMFCDFGLARVVQDHPSGLTTKGFDEAGTMPYQSPELVHVPGTRRNAKTDTWAWASVLVEVLTDKQPFERCNAYLIFGKLKDGTLPVPVDALPVSARMQTLLGRCWAKEPVERPNMNESGSELKLERATMGAESVATIHISSPQLGDVEDAAASEATPNVPEEDPVPQSLIQALTTLDSYRMSEEIIEIGASVNDFNFGFSQSAVVHRARLNGAFRTAADGAAVVVRKITLEGERRERLKQAEKYTHSISIWVGSNDPNVYPLLGFYFDADFGGVWLVGPWEENGNLQHYIKRVNPSRAERVRLAVDVARGVRSLHAQSSAVIYGGLSVFNVAVGSAGQAMITNFSYSRRTGLTISPARTDSLKSTAPEVEEGHYITPASDVWAFGCLLLKIFLDKYPRWRGRPAPPEALSALPEDLTQLMLDCWKLEPDERPTMQQCIDVLTRLREQEIQNPSPPMPTPSTEESNSDSDSMGGASDGDVEAGTDEDSAVREDVTGPLSPPLPSPLVQSPSADVPASKTYSPPGAYDVDDGSGTNELPEEVRRDQEEDAQSGSGCTIQ